MSGTANRTNAELAGQGSAAHPMRSDGVQQRPTAADSALPMHLLLTGRRVVVVGGGTVAARKVTGCLAAGADVVVISPQLGAALRARVQRGEICWAGRGYRPGDVAGSWLVFATTPEREVNTAVEAEAEDLRVFCVRADSHQNGSARTPAVARGSGVVVGVSSVGPANPVHVIQVRDAIAEVLAGQPRGPRFLEPQPSTSRPRLGPSKRSLRREMPGSSVSR